MATSFFKVLTPNSGLVVYGSELTANGAAIKEGLMVTLDSGGRQVSLAATTGSKPMGVAFGDRFTVYAPTTKTFANAEVLSVVTGTFLAAVSADYFSSGSLPTEVAPRLLYSGANGLLDVATNALGPVARLIDRKTYTAGTGGTGASVEAAVVQYDFGITTAS